MTSGTEAKVVGGRELFDEVPDLRAVRAYLGDPRNIFLMAYEGELPVGFVRGTELGQLGSEKGQLFLYEIAVLESHRRRGIGSALVRALLDHCRSNGLEEMFVFTDDPANRAAHRLYVSTGAVTETPGDRMYVYRLEGNSPVRQRP